MFYVCRHHVCTPKRSSHSTVACKPMATRLAPAAAHPAKTKPAILGTRHVTSPTPPRPCPPLIPGPAEAAQQGRGLCHHGWHCGGCVLLHPRHALLLALGARLRRAARSHAVAGLAAGWNYAQCVAGCSQVPFPTRLMQRQLDCSTSDCGGWPRCSATLPAEQWCKRSTVWAWNHAAAGFALVAGAPRPGKQLTCLICWF